MESAISQVAKMTPHLCSSPKIHFPSVIISLPSQNKQIFRKDRFLRSGLVSKLKCGKGGGSSVSSSKLEKKLMENEELSIEIEEELIGMKKLNENCQGIGGIVEVLECLEREAIMGEDEGRDPNDYNRRAMIFDRSSRVFQALKQTNSDD